MRIANCKDPQREIVMSFFNKFSQLVTVTNVHTSNTCTNTRMDVMHIRMLTTGL